MTTTINPEKGSNNMRDNTEFITVNSNKELRCSHCNKKFLEGDLGHGGSISLKCARCKTINKFMKIP